MSSGGIQRNPTLKSGCQSLRAIDLRNTDGSLLYFIQQSDEISFLISE
jgi:hypothetical protein